MMQYIATYLHDCLAFDKFSQSSSTHFQFEYGEIISFIKKSVNYKEEEEEEEETLFDPKSANVQCITLS